MNSTTKYKLHENSIRYLSWVESLATNLPNVRSPKNYLILLVYK